MTPTSKQLVISSLNALRKARTKALFKVKALRLKRRDISDELGAVLEEVYQLERKMDWEINTNGKSLKDKR